MNIQATINITVNDVQRTLNVGTKLIDLLKDLKESGLLKTQAGFAVAQNNCVVSKSDWNTCFLNDKDQILIIVPTQGG